MTDQEKYLVQIAEKIVEDMTTVYKGLTADRTVNEQEAEAMERVTLFIEAALRVFEGTSAVKIRTAFRLAEMNRR